MAPFTRRGFLRSSCLTAGGALAGVCCLANTVHASAARWTDFQTYPPFHCRATFPLEPLKPMFRELASLERELRRTLALPPGTESVDVLLFSSERQHRDYCHQHLPRTPYRRALYLQRNDHASVLAYRHPELPIDLRHECTHALLHASFPMVPLWLDEGLAEYFEMPESRRAFHHPHLDKLRWNLRLGMIQTVESLEDARDLQDMGGAEYRFAWAWVHFMLHGPVPAHRALVHYLADIQRGQPPGKLSERLREAVPQLEDRMTQHFRNWRA
ncbi:MAG: twin-arginine translocation signal domain-containing protein [Planctomycetota bacterium]